MMNINIQMSHICTESANAIYIFIINYPLIMKLLISSILFSSTSIFVLLGLITSYGHGSLSIEPKYRSKDSVVTSFSSFRDLSIIISGFICSFLTSITLGDIAYVYVSEALSVDKALATQIIMYSGIVASYVVTSLADILIKYQQLTPLI